MNVTAPAPGSVADAVGAAIDGLTDAELRHHMARAAGVLAYRRGDKHAVEVLYRIALGLSAEGCA